MYAELQAVLVEGESHVYRNQLADMVLEHLQREIAEALVILKRAQDKNPLRPTLP